MREENSFAVFISDLLYTLLRIFSWICLVAIIIIVAYETPCIFTWNDLTDEYKCTMGNFYIDEKYNVDDVKKLNEFVNTLPPVFKREFRNTWRVIIDDYMPRAIGGYTDWNSRIIYINIQSNFADTLNIFAHELGHCFDFEYGSVSYGDLFGNVYDLYKDDFGEGHSTSSAEEFFATCFEEYLLHPNYLKTVAPKAYNFVDNFYEEVQKIKYVYIYDFGAVANTILRLAE